MLRGTRSRLVNQPSRRACLKAISREEKRARRALAQVRNAGTPMRSPPSWLPLGAMKGFVSAFATVPFEACIEALKRGCAPIQGHVQRSAFPAHLQSVR